MAENGAVQPRQALPRVRHVARQIALEAKAPEKVLEKIPVRPQDPDFAEMVIRCHTRGVSAADIAALFTDTTEEDAIQALRENEARIVESHNLKLDALENRIIDGVEKTATLVGDQAFIENLARKRPASVPRMMTAGVHALAALKAARKPAVTINVDRNVVSRTEALIHELKLRAREGRIPAKEEAIDAFWEKVNNPNQKMGHIADDVVWPGEKDEEKPEEERKALPGPEAEKPADA